MKTCRNHLDLSVAKVGVLSQSSRFIASKSRGFVTIISIYRQQKSRFCAIISIYRQQKSQKCLAFCEIRAKNLIFRFRAKILIFSFRANLNIRFIASKSRGFVAIISIYRQQKSQKCLFVQDFNFRLEKSKKQQGIYRQQNSNSDKMAKN